MRIAISNSSALPIYEQIKDQVKSAIFKGELAEGEMLPSIRQLAKDLKISVITTTRAYTDLEQEGFINNVQGKGCYVMPINSSLVREQVMRDIEAGFEAVLNAARIGGVGREELKKIFDDMCKEGFHE